MMIPWFDGPVEAPPTPVIESVPCLVPSLPSCVAISKDINPPVWMWLGGAIFGSAAHFINVIKDMDQDRASGIGGAPQRLGKRNSIVAAGLLIALGILVLIITI
jgi:4-hydroxybenzoate polyprenyltransferase